MERDAVLLLHLVVGLGFTESGKQCQIVIFNKRDVCLLRIAVPLLFHAKLQFV